MNNVTQTTKVSSPEPAKVFCVSATARDTLQLEVSSKAAIPQMANFDKKTDAKTSAEEAIKMRKIINDLLEDPNFRNTEDGRKIAEIQRLSLKKPIPQVLRENPSLNEAYKRASNPEKNPAQSAQVNANLAAQLEGKFLISLNPDLFRANIKNESAQPATKTHDKPDIRTEREILLALQEELKASHYEHKVISTQLNFALAASQLASFQKQISDFQRSNNKVSNFIQAHSAKLPINQWQNNANGASIAIEKFVSLAGHVAPLRALLHIDQQNNPVKKGQLYGLLVQCYGKALSELGKVDLDNPNNVKSLENANLALKTFNAFFQTALSGQVPNSLLASFDVEAPTGDADKSLKNGKILKGYINAMVAFIGSQGSQEQAMVQHK